MKRRTISELWRWSLSLTSRSLRRRTADLARQGVYQAARELIRLYQKQCELHAAAQSDAEIALTDSLLADLEGISRQAHEETGFTYTPLSEIAALN